MAINLSEKLNQLLTDVKAQHIEVSDSTNIYQCFDFAYLWVFCLGFPKATIQHLKAYEIYTQPSSLTTQYFDIIANTPDGVPEAGDLVIFSDAVGKAGHVSIATGEGDTKSFKSADQNWNGNNLVQIVSHNYTSVLGWLRPKIKENQVDIDQATYKALIDAFNGLPQNDPLKQGNIEGYVRSITEEHLTANENLEKAKILDGFISKWKLQYQLSTDSNLTDIETQMNKGIEAEDLATAYRSAIEQAVHNTFTDDKALLGALQGLTDENKSLTTKLDKCIKTSGTPLNVFTIGSYTIKVYKG